VAHARHQHCLWLFFRFLLDLLGLLLFFVDAFDEFLLAIFLWNQFHNLVLFQVVFRRLAITRSIIIFLCALSHIVQLCLLLELRSVLLFLGLLFDFHLGTFEVVFSVDLLSLCFLYLLFSGFVLFFFLLGCGFLVGRLLGRFIISLHAVVGMVVEGDAVLLA